MTNQTKDLRHGISFRYEGLRKFPWSPEPGSRVSAASVLNKRYVCFSRVTAVTVSVMFSEPLLLKKLFHCVARSTFLFYVTVLTLLFLSPFRCSHLQFGDRRQTYSAFLNTKVGQSIQLKVTWARIKVTCLLLRQMSRWDLAISTASCGGQLAALMVKCLTRIVKYYL